MKNKVLFLGAMASVALLAVTAEAAPYAGVIRTSSQSIGAGGGLDVSYYLPYAADTVSIDILDGSNGTVATFAGTAASGLNTVTWDGTNDNAGGTALATGNGYQVEITVDLAAAAGMTSVASNDSSATLFSGFSGVGAHTQTDDSSDSFGYVFARSSTTFTTPDHAAAIVLTPDLQPLTGDGFASRVNIAPDEGAASVGNGSNWGASFVPGTDNVLYMGQGGVQQFIGTDAFATNAAAFASASVIAGNARDVATVDEGGQLYAYYATGNSTINKYPIGTDGEPTADDFNILALVDTALYSKDVEFDAAGNLYWTSRNGFLYRWDAAAIQAIDDDTDTKLTEADATWVIDFSGATYIRTVGSAITASGNVYTIATDGSGETDSAIYLVGDASTATLTKSVLDADIAVSPGNIADGVYGNLDSDSAGNLIATNRSPETITLLAEGGASSVTTQAPDSQDFNITASVGDWSTYSN